MQLRLEIHFLTVIVTTAKSGPQNTDLFIYLQISEMGGSKGVLELDSFVAEQLALLGLEREAEMLNQENDIHMKGHFLSMQLMQFTIWS